MSNNPCRRAVLQSDVLELGNFEHADGQKSNNILNMTELLRHPDHSDFILGHLGEIATRYEPDLLIGVPTGGQKFADKLSDDERVCLNTAQLIKIEDKSGLKKYSFASEEDEDMVINAQKIVVIEDVFIKFTSVRGVLALPRIIEKTQAVIGVWDRGRHPSRRSLNVPVHALVTEYIPNFLREADEIYQYGVPKSEAK